MIAHCMYRVTGSWSANRVVETVRAFGLKMRREDIVTALRDCKTPGRTRSISPVDKSEMTVPTTVPGTITGTVVALSPQGPLSPTPPISPNPSLGLFSNPSGLVGADFAASTEPSLKSKKARKTPDLSWVEPLKATTRELLSLSLSDVPVEHRFTLAMYHCYRYGNCTVAESRNRRCARSVAAGIANLANDRRHGSLTVRDYLAAGDIVWERGGKAPWFKPWDVTAIVEREA